VFGESLSQSASIILVNEVNGSCGETIKLSVVVICLNDIHFILNCIRSIYAQTTGIQFEVIVADNGSTDGSVLAVREQFPQVLIVENRRNLGFGPGNNAAMSRARGEYVLVLNPDTIIHKDALETMVAYADRHPEAGAFGCRVLNCDGSLQHTAQPIPTVWRYLVAALCLRPLGRFFNSFQADTYQGWDGCTERSIGFHAACCLLLRTQLLKEIGFFDPRFLHQFEDADLCLRVWNTGAAVLYCPDAEITHIGGHSRGGYPLHVVLNTERSKYHFFRKHYGRAGVRGIRCVSLIGLGLRYSGYSLLDYLRPAECRALKIQTYRQLLKWHWHFNPHRFVEGGTEPTIADGIVPTVTDSKIFRDSSSSNRPEQCGSARP